MSSQVFIKLEEGVSLPTRGSEHAAGYDIRCIHPACIEPGWGTLMHTGVYISMPNDMQCEIRPRSGLATKRALIIPNAPGTLDADYTGEVMVYLHNIGNTAQFIEAGDRIAQLVFSKFEAVDFTLTEELDDTERGSGGFGSTGMA